MDEIKEMTENGEEIAETADNSAEIEGDVSRETFSENADGASVPEVEEPENEGDKPILWSTEYRLTKEEQEAFADNSGLFSGKKKTIMQGGLAALLCVINGVSYATGGNKMTLFLCILCAVLCGAIFIVPMVTRKNMLATLNEAAEKGEPTRLKSTGDTLIFGAQGEEVSYGYEKTTVRTFEKIATLLLSDGQMVCVPRRTLTDEAWAELCAHITAKK